MEIDNDNYGWDFYLGLQNCAMRHIKGYVIFFLKEIFTPTVLQNDWTNLMRWDFCGLSTFLVTVLTQNSIYVILGLYIHISDIENENDI